MDNLFQLGEFTLSSGEKTHFKIDCDALVDDDIACIAKLVVDMVGDFEEVIGVPTGGLRLARALQKYKVPGCMVLLLVDDVLTTGRNIQELLTSAPTKDVKIKGAVIFARGECPAWVTPVFQLGAGSGKRLIYDDNIYPRKIF